MWYDPGSLQGLIVVEMGAEVHHEGEEVVRAGLPLLTGQEDRLRHNGVHVLENAVVGVPAGAVLAPLVGQEFLVGGVEAVPGEGDSVLDGDGEVFYDNFLVATKVRVVPGIGVGPETVDVEPARFLWGGD